jgi:hypothetical protein
MMTEKVKAFLRKKFEDGIRTGSKSDPVQSARKMKTLKNEDGRPTFVPEEWRTSKQISSLFSRLKAAHRKKCIDAEDILEEDIKAAQSEEALDSLISLVMDDMNKPSNLISVGSINICERVKSSKLVSLKLAALKEICNELHLCEAIDVYANSCTCLV